MKAKTAERQTKISSPQLMNLKPAITSLRPWQKKHKGGTSLPKTPGRTPVPSDSQNPHDGVSAKAHMSKHGSAHLGSSVKKVVTSTQYLHE
jgi:hypothetical protein